MNERIKFGEIQIGNIARKHINECLDSNWVTMGPKVKAFEEKLAYLFSAKYAVAVNSGTSADQAMCMALYDFGAKRGDEIIVPALSFIATATAVVAAGFVPVFVDVDRTTLQINPTLIENAITDRTVAIMPVCLMGKPYDVRKIWHIAETHRLFILADCCESHGALVDGRMIEEYADMCAYSFYSAHVSFAAQFGAIVSKYPEFEEPLRSIRSHGRANNSLYFDHCRMGYNFMPTDIHAAIGLEGLDMFRDNFAIRKSNLKHMQEDLRHIDKYVHFVEQNENEVNSPHAMSITLKSPEYDLAGLCKALDDANIEYKRNFGSMPEHTCFSYLGLDCDKYPEARYIGNNGIHWACHRYLTDEDMDRIVNVVSEHFKRFS